MKDRQDRHMDRRSFLRSVGGVSTVAVAAAAAPIMTTPAEAYDPGSEQTRSRYQPDSEYVKAFYRTNGYETLKK